MARFAIIVFFNQKNLAMSEKCRTFAAEMVKQVSKRYFLIIV